jgi:hypothetical protein
MEKRRYNRAIARLKAVRKLDGTDFTIFIENISVYGLYMITASAINPNEYIPGDIHELKLYLPSGEKLDIHCKIKWSVKAQPDDLINTAGILPPSEYTAIGAEIIDPPSKYIEFLETLQ